MSGFAEVSFSPEDAALRRVGDLLGGTRVLHRPLQSPLDAHEMLLRGLPSQALSHLIDGLTVIEMDAPLEKVLGMSLRTYQRRKEGPAKRLSADQSARTWKFAEILAKATEVFGSQEEAERWLERPATGLNRQRPIDLLATPAGGEMVDRFLGQLEYGVYV